MVVEIVAQTGSELNPHPGPWLIYLFFSVVSAVRLIFQTRRRSISLCGHLLLISSLTFLFLSLISRTVRYTKAENISDRRLSRGYIDPSRLARLPILLQGAVAENQKKSSGRVQEKIWKKEEKNKTISGVSN